MVGSSLTEQEFRGKKLDVGQTAKINDEPFLVVGVLKSQGNFIFDSSIIMNEDDLRSLMDVSDDEYDVIVSQIDDGADIDAVQENIEKVLRKERDVDEGEEDFTVQSPQAVLATVNSTLFAVQLFVYIIAGISILVGGIGIMNTMFTSVVERTRDIGIMKSIGARNSTIFYLFFIESGLLGMVGGILGALFGTGLSMVMSAVASQALGSDLIQAYISPWLLFGAIMGSFFLGSIFGIIPALNAAKLHPVDALRHKK